MSTAPPSTDSTDSTVPTGPASPTGAVVRPVCVVTGSSSGIGAATARLFAEHGHDVVINYTRRAGPAEEVAQQCRALGAQVLVQRADVADDAQCRALAGAVQARWGRAQVLVNCAGTTTKFTDLKDLGAIGAEDFEAIYRVNVIGIFQMSRALAPLLRAQPGAAIVNISSMGGRMGTGSSIAYAASKGAVNTLTLSLARALAPGIRVNAVLPGMVDGDWLRNGLGPEVFAAREQRYRTRALLQSIVDPQDVARAVFWLATGAGRTTGHLLDVDGGFQMG